MVPGNHTNTVYLSEKLLSDNRFTATCNALTALLDKHGISYGFLKGTKDIRCRDYMPIQTGRGEFVQFRYEPSYLEDDLDLQSDTREVCRLNDIKVQFSGINLDGGNVVNWSDRAIITDRVFDENPAYTNKAKLASEIENLLEVEVIIIPQIKSDMTGHADGLVRFVDKDTLVGNCRENEYIYWKNGINKVLKAHGINYIDIPFVQHKEPKFPEHAIGCYLNYLEVGDLIVLPIFEVRNNHDQKVYETFQQIFAGRKLETMNYNAVARFGGLLNCTTWTVKR